MKTWADAEEGKRRNQGGILGHLRNMNDVARSTVQGTAVGKWGDQINAYLASSGVPGFGGGEGRTYEQELALQQARNRATETEHPIGHTIAGLVGGTGAAWLTGGIGGPATQTLLDTASAVSNSASNAPDGSRGEAGVAGGAATLPISAILNGISSKFAKYSQLTPEIVAAAKQLGIELPFFAKAENQGVQATGRQYAQTHPASSLNKSWEAGSESVGDTAGRLATQGTGSADVRVAPYDAGTQVRPGLQASIDASQTEKGRLGDEIASLLEPRARYDVPGTRATTRDMVRERRGFEDPSPTAGLESPIRVAARPPPTEATQGPWGQRGGSSWPEISNLATDIGQRLNLPPNIPRAVDDARLGKIYAALREDQRLIMRNADAADATPPVAPGTPSVAPGAASVAPDAPSGPPQIPAMPHQVEAAVTPQIAPSSSSTAVGAPRLSEQSTGGQLAAAIENPAGPVRQPGAAPEQPWSPSGYDRPREEIFNRNVERQRVLSETQRQIDATMKDRPEAIINLAHNAATVGGAGTDINTLHTMVTAMTPEQRQVLGSGVLAKIANDSGGSPAQMATTLNKMAPEARDLLFTPGTQLASDVAALTAVSERVGAVNARQGTGSAATLGERMANMGRSSGPAVAAGSLAHLLGAGPSTAAGVAAGVGLPQFAYNRYAKPYLLQHGVPPEVKAAVDAAMRGGVRQVGPAVSSLFNGVQDPQQLPPVTVEAP
jgi:hypothetical protein